MARRLPSAPAFGGVPSRRGKLAASTGTTTTGVNYAGGYADAETGMVYVRGRYLDAHGVSRGTHYQGEHWRRVARLAAGVWIAIVLGPGLVRPRPVEQMLAGVVLVAVLLLLAEWPLARRMGFTIAPGGLVLHTALGRRKLPWEEVDHFAWQTWRGETQCLYAIGSDGRRILIPTLQRGSRGWRARYLGSARVRTRDCRRADALAELEAALDAARGVARLPGSPAGDIAASRTT